MFGREPSRWALAHISSISICIVSVYLLHATVFVKKYHYDFVQILVSIITIITAYFVMVALWNRTDHYIFIL